MLPGSLFLWVTISKLFLLGVKKIVAPKKKYHISRLLIVSKEPTGINADLPTKKHPKSRLAKVCVSAPGIIL
jgi:hypothetical protein